MSHGTKTDRVLSQILSCLDAAANRPGLVKASINQTEGYLRGFQRLAWERSPSKKPHEEDIAASFLHDIRNGAVSLRGRVSKESGVSIENFLVGLEKAFPGARKKGFSGAMSRLWVRWSGHRNEISGEAGQNVGNLLKTEYEEGIAGGLSAYILDQRLHLRDTRDYLRMRGWLQGVIAGLKTESSWEDREKAAILEGNFSSIVLRALHNANVDYASIVVSHLPLMTKRLDQSIESLAEVEPESAHFLRKNRLTIITRALHSGYLDYPEEAAAELPKALKDLNGRIALLESSSPDDARKLRSDVPAILYQALTNGHLDAVTGVHPRKV